MWHGTVEDHIRHLQNELDAARRAIIEVMPYEVSERLGTYYRCKTRDDAYDWEREVVEFIIDKAEPLPERLSFCGGDRAYCPLCHRGSQGPYDEGFALPEGLRRHLTGYGNTHQCGVMEAAFRLAYEYWNSTVEVAEQQKRESANAAKALRRKTEILFKRGPNEEPALMDERCWLGDQPRNQEELRWAEDRLSQLGFNVVLDDRVKSYVKEYGEYSVYADPREKKKISFYVYPKKVPKRRRYPAHLGSFHMMDSWKHDLPRKFEERCRTLIPQEGNAERNSVDAVNHTG
jgi:hypothetical protein